MLREETAALMPPFDAVDYLLYVRRRWGVIALSCVLAGALAFGGSLLLPKRYTSTASILIEFPVRTDPRTYTVVSPVYLESLKTYERVALGDSLFQRAMERFKMFDSSRSQSVESVKNRVLKVTKVRDTKILEISVTLKNPNESQAMAQFLAEETVKLSSVATREAGRDLTDEAGRHLDEARGKLEKARDVWAKQIAAEPIETLRQEIGSLLELEQRLRRNAAEARASAAEYEARAKPNGDGADAKKDSEFMAQESASHLARARQLQTELEQVQKRVEQKDRLIGARTVKREAAEAELRVAQARFDAASGRAEGLQSSVGFAGERLRIIDPGIVPQRPSEPKKGLNVMIAVTLALLGSAVYVTLAYNFQR